MASENFNQFGPTFQAKVISSLLSDNKFIQTISDILEPEYFDSDANKWLTKEINDSKTILEKITKNNIPGISFAHGSFNNDTMNILKKSSYDFAATSIKGINTNDMQKFLLRRNEIVSNDKICDLDKKIKGYYDYY